MKNKKGKIVLNDTTTIASSKIEIKETNFRVWTKETFDINNDNQ